MSKDEDNKRAAATAHEPHIQRAEERAKRNELAPKPEVNEKERDYLERSKHDNKATSSVGPDSTRPEERMQAQSPEHTLAQRHEDLLNRAKSYKLGDVHHQDVNVGLAVLKVVNDLFRRNSLIGLTEADEYGLIRAMSGEEPIFSPETQAEEAHGVQTGAIGSKTKAKLSDEHA